MTSPPAAVVPEKVLRLIHLALCMGFTLLAAVIVAMRVAGSGPPITTGPLLGVILAGVGVMAIAISLAIMRPRVGQRGSTESPADFWTAERRAAVIVVWALIEGGALASCVGYILTGLWTPLAVVPIALLAMYVVRPGAFEA